MPSSSSKARGGKAILSSGDWKKGWSASSEPAIHMELPTLEAAYNDEGKQLKPLPVRVEGDLAAARRIFS